MTNKTEIQEIIEDFDKGHKDWIDTKARLNTLENQYEHYFKKLIKKVRLYQINFLIALIVAMLVSFWFMFGGAGSCQDNPFQYGADYISSNHDGNIECKCTFYPNEDSKTQTESFKFKNNGFPKELDFSEGYENYLKNFEGIVPINYTK